MSIKTTYGNLGRSGGGSVFGTEEPITGSDGVIRLGYNGTLAVDGSGKLGVSASLVSGEVGTLMTTKQDKHANLDALSTATPTLPSLKTTGTVTVEGTKTVATQDFVATNYQQKNTRLDLLASAGRQTALAVVDDVVTTANSLFAVLTPALNANQFTTINVGKSAANYQCGRFTYNHVADGSVDNNVAIHLYGMPAGLTVDGAGKATVGNANEATTPTAAGTLTNGGLGVKLDARIGGKAYVNNGTLELADKTYTDTQLASKQPLNTKLTALGAATSTVDVLDAVTLRVGGQNVATAAAVTALTTTVATNDTNTTAALAGKQPLHANLTSLTQASPTLSFLNLTDATTGPVVHMQAVAGNLSSNQAGSFSCIQLGRAISTNNMGRVYFNNVASGSASNSISLGLWGSSHGLKVDGNGIMTTLNTTDATSATVAGTLTNGGLGVAKKIYAGDAIYASGTQKVATETWVTTNAMPAPPAPRCQFIWNNASPDASTGISVAFQKTFTTTLTAAHIFQGYLSVYANATSTDFVMNFKLDGVQVHTQTFRMNTQGKHEYLPFVFNSQLATAGDHIFRLEWTGSPVTFEVGVSRIHVMLTEHAGATIPAAVTNYYNYGATRNAVQGSY